MLRTAFALPFLLLASSHAFAAKTCEFTVEGTDAMAYSTKEIDVAKDCTELKITLKHSGKLPKAAMGHNLVVSTEKDMPAIVTAGTSAGPGKDYIPAGDKRIIGHTKLVGGGESDTVTIKVADFKKGESYKYFCTFPGHSTIMNGVFKF